MQITGNSRDWAFVAASDLEDRIKRIKSLSFDALFSSKFSQIWIMMLSMIIMVMVSQYFTPDKKTHILLQQQYSAGQLHNPIEALIALERIKNERTVIAQLLPLIIGFGVPMLGFILVSFVAPRISPSYNFCWGDYVSYYERRKQIQMVFWTVVVLGLVVAIAANFFSKKLGL